VQFVNRRQNQAAEQFGDLGVNLKGIMMRHAFALWEQKTKMRIDSILAKELQLREQLDQRPVMRDAAQALLAHWAWASARSNPLSQTPPLTVT
jgi:hypothetical protein